MKDNVLGADEMRTLAFSSDVLRYTTRYSDTFALPEYPYLPNGAFDRAEALRMLTEEEYGRIDDSGLSWSASVQSTEDKQFAGKCQHLVAEFVFERETDRVSFPLHLFLPYAHPNAELILHLNFHPEFPNRYLPLEELMDRGVAIAHLCYRDVTSDDGDFTNGLARLTGRRNEPHAAGKLAIWSYAASCAATWLLENGFVRADALYVAGHSRLGKTALLTAARDPRFCGVLVNCSGCCGAAISREKTGETLEAICRVFPYWFAPRFLQYVDREREMPFDQHWLLALVAPRKLCIVTAEEDTWADTDAQYLAAEAANVIYQKAGVEGLVCDGMLLQGQQTTRGQIAFSKRGGTHFFSRADWNFFIDFIRKPSNET